MKVMLFPGTFDPFTRGHRDIARRASKLCDELVVAVMENSAKTPLFTIEEREDLIRKSLTGEELDHIKVMKWDGLLVDLYSDLGCCAVVRGIRSESDFRYEAELALANRLLYPGYDAVLLPCRDDMSLISSTIVKEVGFYGGDISKMVPAEILEEVKDKFKKGRKQ
ncbi:MAG: pantetheine-phosphate adenylyltransferase [Saccharofermentans sp.]|nr:pantetheine-phosphate adenylyltransferase [Clostridiales bacterium]MCR5488946.1 pantetheine-phosphate adenylyltransferase [Saccharofermentans sp.]